MPFQIDLGERGKVDLPVFDGGVFEDCESEFNTIAEYYAQEKIPVPMGKVAAAFFTVAHRALQDQIPDLKRDEVRRAIKGARAVVRLGEAIVESFGLGAGDAPAGEGQSPSAST